MRRFHQPRVLLILLAAIASLSFSVWHALFPETPCQRRPRSTRPGEEAVQAFGWASATGRAGANR